MHRFFAGLIVPLAVAATVAVVAAPDVADAVDPCDGSDPPGYCDDGPPVVHRRPRGSLDEAARRPGGILVTGWVNDPDRGNGAMTVLVNVGGQSTTVSASLLRGDSAVGFNAVVPTTLSGTLSVCATALNVGPGINTPIGCHSVTVQHDPIGSLDEVTSGLFSVRVRGWAIDPDTGSPIDVHVYQDGAFAGGWAAGANRPDVDAAYPGYGALHGFDILLPHPTTTSHTICVYAINISTGTVNTLLGCRNWVETHGPPVAPTLDELHTGRPYPEGAPLQAHLYFNDNSTDETRFEVAVQGGNWSQWASLGSLPGDTATGRRTVSLGRVLPETTYCFQVHAYNTNWWTHSAAEGCFTTTRLPPLSPGNLTVTAAGTTSLKVEWDDRTAEPDAYRFWYREQPEDTVFGGDLGRPRYVQSFPGVGRRTITLPPNLSPGTRYCVTAVTIVGEALSTPTATSTPWWLESSRTTRCASTDAPPPPAQPTGLTVSGGSQTSLDLQWADNADNETGYRVDRQQGSSWTKVADLRANSVRFTHSGLLPGVTLCYRVVAINAGAETASDTACGTTRGLIGIKTANIWNCESHQASGTLWMFDHSVGGQWTRVGNLPTSWTTSGCGSGRTPQNPAASIDLPNGHYVTLAAVFVDSVCTTGDPAESRCRHWELQNALGDANGLVVPFDFG